MEPSGPTSLSDLEADVALSDGDDMGDEIWPGTPPVPVAMLVMGAEGASRPVSPATRQPTATQHPTIPASSTSKRPLSCSSDTNSEPSSPRPTTKSSKLMDSSGAHRPPQETGTYRPAPLLDSSHGALSPPAFAPRAHYVKLSFKGNLSVDVKLRWLSEVKRGFHLDRDKAEVKMSAITSRFVYISRRRPDIVRSVTSGEFLSLSLEIHDSPERPRKFSTYLLTRYPVTTDPALAKDLPGIHTARRFRQDGTPINRLVVTWSLPQPPPPSFAFDFLPCLPPCQFRQMKDEQPWCYRCWNFGHISRYCSASERCAYCSEPHDSRTCPHRPTPAPALASDPASMQQDPAVQDTSLWKCPRCLQPGVNVWHPGCSQRRVATAPVNHVATHASGPPPPKPPHSVTPSPVTITSDTPQVTALSDAVATLQTRVASLVTRLDTIEARLDSLISKQATFGTTLTSMAESQTVIINSIIALTERLDTVASRLDTLTAPPMGDPQCNASPRGARVTPTSSSGHRPPHQRVQ